MGGIGYHRRCIVLVKAKPVTQSSTQLLLLEAPLSVMCGGCGDVKSIAAAPATRAEWERINREFHCRCEVG
jgi:hypothetical protein